MADAGMTKHEPVGVEKIHRMPVWQFVEDYLLRRQRVAGPKQRAVMLEGKEVG